MEPSQISPKTTWLQSHWQLWSLALLALVLSIGYCSLAIAHLGLEDFWHYAPDTSVYWNLSEYFLHGDPHGPYILLRVGPGYGFLLASVRLVFGSHPLIAIGLNIFLGSLAPVVVYLLAKELLESRLIAYLAGLISAASLTSIVLSCHILTDQPFYTLQVASLFCYVRGLRTTATRWFVAAGFFGSAAVLVRSSSIFWPLVLLLLPLVVPTLQGFRHRYAQFRKAVPAGAIMLTVVLGWSARNWVVHDLFVFGTNGMFTIRSCLVAQAITDHYADSTIAERRTVWEMEDGDRSEEYVEAYGRARHRLEQVVREHPGWLFSAYWRNVSLNVREANTFIGRQVPSLGTPVRWLDLAVKNWLGYLLIGLSFLGLILLVLDRRYLAAVLLGATYIYYTLVTGVSFWQGSRLHHPAEMAWSILVPFAVLRVAQLAWTLLAGSVRRAES